MVVLASSRLLAKRTLGIRSTTFISSQHHGTIRSGSTSYRNIQTSSVAPHHHQNHHHHATARCTFSSLSSGTDLLADSLGFSGKPKISFDGHGPTGIDVVNVLPPEGFESFQAATDERADVPILPLHMNGSCLAFPHSCFLWQPRTPKEVTLESLEIVLHVRPAVELLFIGCDVMIPPRELNRIKNTFKQRRGIVVEQMTLANAMATFNILNGEDRRVAAAIVLAEEED